MVNQGGWSSLTNGRDKRKQKGVSKSSKTVDKCSLSPPTPKTKVGDYYDPMNNSGVARQIASSLENQLETKLSKPKQTKLLSSKSLSHLLPRGLFFKKTTEPAASNGKPNSNNNGLTTSKSFPNPAFHPSPMSVRLPEFTNRLDSTSLIGLPRESSNCSFGHTNSNSNSLEQPNFSPIAGPSPVGQPSSGPKNCVETFNMSLDEERSVARAPESQSPESVKGQPVVEQKKKAARYTKPFKNTTLVLRDVKNSIGLRMKAKHESQAFAKLTDELMTPPTKLYSPFNIYTEDSCSKDSKSRRKLNLHNNGKANEDFEMADSSVETPKVRIALRHKKHLMQSKFTFDSPTGKLRETVKDVEQFQQCIEDISAAIRARDQSL